MTGKNMALHQYFGHFGFCCFFSIIAIIMIIYYSIQIENAKPYENGTLTLCTVIHRNDDESCNHGRTTGERYTYTAESPLCPPGVELHSKIEACQWKPEDKDWYDYDEIMKVDLYETAECYVPDCSENSFAWDWDIKWQRDGSWFLIHWTWGMWGAMVCFIIGSIIYKRLKKE